jgi:hypothetical protein
MRSLMSSAVIVALTCGFYLIGVGLSRMMAIEVMEKAAKGRWIGFSPPCHRINSVARGE